MAITGTFYVPYKDVFCPFIMRSRTNVRQLVSAGRIVCLVVRQSVCFTSRFPSTYGAAKMKSIVRSSLDLLLRSARISTKIPARIPALSLAAAAATLAFSACAPTFAQDSDTLRSGDSRGQPVKVMIISMFGPEGQVWLDKLGPWQAVKIPGLSPDYPDIHCNVQDVCVIA